MAVDVRRNDSVGGKVWEKSAGKDAGQRNVRNTDGERIDVEVEEEKLKWERQSAAWEWKVQSFPSTTVQKQI